MRGALPLAGALLALWAAPAAAQGAGQANQTTVIDSVAVIGARRVARAEILRQANLPVGQAVSYRDTQRAIEALYAGGQFDDVRISQATVGGKVILRIEVSERPILTRWAVRGAEKVAERTVRGRVHLDEGSPYDPAGAAASVASIDSLYKHQGYYSAKVELQQLQQDDGTLHLIFNIDEGSRVAISQIIIEGNSAFTDKDVVGGMSTRPEGFFWFQKGDYKEDQLERDLTERLPGFYGARGHVDFQVLRDTLVAHEGTGKGTLILAVDEGLRYEVGTFEVVGNRHFSSEQIEQFYPFRNQATGFLGLGGMRAGPVVFDQERWEGATQNARNLYFNNGYIYADVRSIISRRVRPDSTHVVDLRWQIVEGQPAIINRVIIAGNTVTHESVVRRALITLVPGDIFRQDALIRAYQSLSNLGYFEQPIPIPETQRANDQGDVDIIFRVDERKTGNVNFGASVGQGTGLGGFIGLDEPNLLGRGKRIAFQWQFGRNINDFNVSYTDPSIRGGLISGTLSLHNTRLRYTIADLGRITTRGGSLQVGFPLFGARYTRVYTTYTLERSNYDSPTLSTRFFCRSCVLSGIQAGVTRDVRVDLPFATGGSMHTISLSQNGGPLGGSGDFRRLTFEGRWYAPLGQLGGGVPGSGSIRFVLGFTAKSGFVWGDVGPHFRQLFSLGGVQFGIPLRGYDEFSVTPTGFDPNARGSSASTVNAFGRAYLATTGELGMRLSQAFYLNGFFDAGNVWAEPRQFNPTRLFRGAGFGLSVLSPLGPLGLDLAYGFDRTGVDGRPAPGWKLHFKLGNFF